MTDTRLTIKQLLAIIAAGLFSFCGVLIETATNITFPTLMNEFSVPTSTVQWMTTGNLLMMGIFIPLSSYLKRRFPTKMLFLTAGLLFGAGLIIDITTSSFYLLLLGRFVQGAGVGIALPMMYNIILEESPPHLLGLMMGCGAFVTAAAPAIGPTFGGAMTQYFSWRYIYICVLPLIILATTVGLICIRSNVPDRDAKMDFKGFVFAAIAFFAMICGLSYLDKIVTNPLLVISCLIVGIMALGYFDKLQIQGQEPLINFEIFQNKTFTFHLLAILFIQMATLGFGLLLPSYVQIVLNGSAANAGLVLLPGAIIGALFAPLGGLIFDKFGARKPIYAGAGCIIVAIAGFLIVFSNLNYLLCISLYFIYSIGLGLTVGNTMTSALASLGTRLQSDGNATIQTMMQLSGAIGTSISAAILAFCQQGVPLSQGTQSGSLFVLAFLAVAICLVGVSQFMAFRSKGKKAAWAAAND